MTDPVKDIDTYLSIQPEKVRIVLEKLRHTIKSMAPESEEVISYQMPAFRYNGMLVGFAAFKDHCSLFPWNSSTVLQFKDELRNFKTSKGTIQFTLERPLPVALVKKIVKARLKENLDKKRKK